MYIAAKIADDAVKLNEFIPMSPAINLRVAEPNPENESLLPETGTFRFIADRARPDILVAVGELSTGGSKEPSDLHLATCQRIKDYLASTADLSVTLGGLGKITLFGYSDASYISEGNAKIRAVWVGVYSWVTPAELSSPSAGTTRSAMSFRPS